ncbi:MULTISPECIES: YcnI family protein [unclassified Crossiella]|uniref:YcnI family copper-binding membrane protein n=1 Tax=unclassified Crossiella TaxID=2620835 RepID=UPI001FFF35F5|nr:MULTISPECIES: YcnI family protein [unclassified Crossiella]MCK2245158.1 YcnI family protein [Crossiella sp. S99.2]MCK2258811.1 YcnI family protein [Crossiella sp. S99.1]
MSTSRHRALLRAGAIVTLTSAAALVTAGLASAHVSVQPGEAAKGSYTKVAFRVPNESATAGTVKLEVNLPKDFPLTSVRTKAVPGWKASVTKVKNGEKDVVSTITWQADQGVRINPDEFAEFEVSLGKLPTNTDQLLLPATQTYDDGKVVKWDAPPAANGQEPDHPAPALKLTAAAGDAHGHGGAATASAVAKTDGHKDAAAAGTDTAARWLGGAGLAVGALGLGFGVGAILRGRRSAA